MAHELTHGVIQYESRLEYYQESGALNEHFADAMSIVAEQWHKGHSVTEADWWLGGEILAPGVRQRGVKGLRTFTEQKPRVAMALGGNSWDKTGKIWYETLKSLSPYSQFQDAAAKSHSIAGRLFGPGSREQQAVKSGWQAVGIKV